MKIDPGVPHADYTDSYPGFVFPFTGKVQFQFNGTPYIFTPGKVVHGGAKMTLAQKMFGKTNWEYILVQYRICSAELEESSFSPGGLSMFQTEMLFRDVLNEALVCVASRQNSCESHALFERVSHSIHEYYNQSLTIASLAEQYNVNRNRLSYVFRSKQCLE